MTVCTNPLLAAPSFVIVAGVKWIHKSGSALPRRNSSTRWPSSPRKRGCSCSPVVQAGSQPSALGLATQASAAETPCVPQAPAWALYGWHTERMLSGKEQWPHLPGTPTPHRQKRCCYCICCKSPCLLNLFSMLVQKYLIYFVSGCSKPSTHVDRRKTTSQNPHWAK